MRNPRLLGAGARGGATDAQDAMVLSAARHVFGRDADLRGWRSALAELDGGGLVPPAAQLDAGITHRVTLGRWLYGAVRVTQPSVVVETGVASGSSSWLILNALARNRSGSLYSIDLPNHDPAKPYNVGMEAETGRAVPDALRARWRLSLGDSRLLLPELLGELAPVGLFFHDSEHTLAAMTREFEAVLPRLEPGGLIVSDDVQKNRAFDNVTRRHGLRSYTFRKGGTARRDG